MEDVARPIVDVHIEKGADTKLLRFSTIVGNRGPGPAELFPDVPDTSENAVANLGWTDIRLPKPVFVGDTLWAESEIVELRPSESRPTVGIVSMRCRGINQRGEVVIEYLRTFMVLRRSAPEARSSFPATDTPWGVG